MHEEMALVWVGRLPMKLMNQGFIGPSVEGAAKIWKLGAALNGFDTACASCYGGECDAYMRMSHNLKPHMDLAVLAEFAAVARRPVHLLC